MSDCRKDKSDEGEKKEERNDEGRQIYTYGVRRSLNNL
jgi:hypothetical protein